MRPDAAAIRVWRRAVAHQLADTVTPIDVTSRGPEPWVRFSPFYPHGGIPIPLSAGLEGASVEGIWQGLKVFEREDIDPQAFANTSMRNLKRGAGPRRGRVLGHRAGVQASELLEYADARWRIYLPAYRWVLEHRLSQELDELRALACAGPVALLDFETNSDVADESRPLSHAALVRAYLLDAWPTPVHPSGPACDAGDTRRTIAEGCSGEHQE